MDGAEIAKVVSIIRQIPDTAAQRAEAAQLAAEQAASTVTSATVEETLTFLGISS